MAQDSLIKVVMDFYSADFIGEAYEKLYDCLPKDGRPNHLRKKTHRGSDVSTKQLKDIIAVLHEMSVTEAFKPPIFVPASILFPSLDIANVDSVALANGVSDLKKEVSSMKRDISSIENLQKSVNDIKALLVSTSKSSAAVNSENPNIVNAAVSYKNLDDNIDMTENTVKRDDTTYKSVLLKNKSVTSPIPQSTRGPKKLFNSTNKHIHANIATAGSSSTSNTGVGRRAEWQVATNKRKLKVGKNEESCIKAVKKVLKPAKIFATRFEPDITADDLKGYLNKQFPNATNIDCKKLATKYPSYASFCLTLNNVEYKDCFNDNNWPAGILIKKFYEKSPIDISTGCDSSASKLPITNSQGTA